jgi:hypothetical protein
MELPTSVLVHNELIGIKGSAGELLNISELGYYEVNLQFGSNVHRVLLPVSSTVVIGREPEERGDQGLDIER